MHKCPFSRPPGESIYGAQNTARAGPRVPFGGATMAQQLSSANGIFVPESRGVAWKLEHAAREWLRRLRTWRQRRRRYWRTVSELSALSDHLLADIGVHRGEIRARAARLCRLPVR